ncbi:MAG: helix-hairpin-helix domain-containing protein, partial [Casimicrobiaceae bacterium]
MKRIIFALVAMIWSCIALSAVNINTATKEQLEALPDIGPVKAQAIVDYRQANGPFKSPEDIMKVNGIKDGIYGKVKGDISTSGANTPMMAPSMGKGAPASAPSISRSAPAPAPASSMAQGAAPTNPSMAAPKATRAEKAKAAKEAKAGAAADKAVAAPTAASKAVVADSKAMSK